MAKRRNARGGARTVRRPANAPVDPKKKIAALKTELARALKEKAGLIAEAREALERQTATAEVLQVINSSPGELAPVFDAILEKAHHLCGVTQGSLQLYDGDQFRAVAVRGLSKAFADRLRQGFGPYTAGRRLLEGERFVHIHDLGDNDEPISRAAFELAGVRTVLFVPLRKDGKLLGRISASRTEVKPFTEKEIALLENFAAQAVIAIENARLFEEVHAKTRDLEESLQQQTAMSEVLQVISSSPGGLAPVFDKMLENATRVCGAEFGSMVLVENDSVRQVALYNAPAALAKARANKVFRPHPQGTMAEAIRTKQAVQVADVRTAPAYRERNPYGMELVELGGARTVVVVPMLREDEVIGAITIYRQEVRRFTDKQIELVSNFAKQAVIAVENARLLTETREALERQTATAEILKVINSSPGNLAPVFETILEKAHSLCAVAHGALLLFDGETFRAAALRRLSGALAERLRQGFVPGPSNPGQRLLEGDRFAQVSDWAELDDPIARATVEAGIRTTLFIPLRGQEKLLGYISASRPEVRPFSEKEAALLESFAAQAVIAIENARLLGELRERQAELARSVDELTATGDVLKTISRSSVDLQAVLDTLVETVARLCRVDQAHMFRRRDDKYYLVSAYGLSAQEREFIDTHPFAADRGSLSGRVELERRPVHIPDVLQDRDYNYPAQKVLGYRTLLGIPLLREETLIGVFVVNRTRVQPFTDKEIELATTFADQAVIAIENARLFEELRQSLQQQTATADVLKVISRSAFDLKTVLQTLVESAAHLCEADKSVITRESGGVFYRSEAHGFPPEFMDYVKDIPVVPEQGSASGRSLLEKKPIHILDVRSDPAYALLDVAKLGDFRTVLAVPILREGAPIGVLSLLRTEVRAFTDKQIELVWTFADQAAIAIENARLLGELRDRQAELARSVDELTATSDVLKIISRSSVELENVLDTLVETVARLCRADQALIFRRRGNFYHLAAAHGVSDEAREFLLVHPLPSDRGSLSGRVELERRPFHIPDVLQDPEYTYLEGQKKQGQRTMLGVPLLREDSLIGIFCINRTRVDPFTTKEIELATTFTDQAVIAIENARLFDELRERQAELRVTFDNMGDGVVMFGADMRLVAWNRNFQEILDLPDDFLGQRPSYVEYFRYLAARGEYSTDLEEVLARTLDDTRRELRLERTRPDGRVIEVRRNAVPGGGFVLIFADITERKRAEEAIRAARDAAETALRDLQAAQASLVHAQKMAALGQLTAGIAHEIKNPLNFVNNFAGLSVELLQELKEGTAEAIARLRTDKRAEVLETIAMLTGNLEKIAEHGRRADGIVRSMLQHSRGSSGDRHAIDVNALVEETLNLAYHGARAQDRDFEVMLELDLEDNLAPIEVVSQDVSRALLNLISNGFYAVTQRGRDGNGVFRPILKIATRESGEGVEIRVRDNGIGIAPEYREKLFQPFFTTKPTGEGTGLGLSISYEIITQQHGGTITVDSKLGDFTEFTVRLPRRGLR